MNPAIAQISQEHPLDYFPPAWGTFDRFWRFYRTRYELDWQAQKRVSGISGHFTRATLLLDLAKRMAPSLAEDEAELEQHWYTPANRARELAAVVDSAFCELYSVLDCVRHVLWEIYHAPSKRIKESTRRTFLKGHTGELGAGLPQAIADAIKATQVWYPPLLKLRDELTHAELGSCYRKKETKTVQYMHVGLWTKFPDGSSMCLILDDVFAVLQDYIVKTNDFLGVVFKELNATLSDKPIDQRCGVFAGRYYERIVKPSEAIDFHGGRCKSFEWFDDDRDHRCPFADVCGAYARAKAEKSDSSP
jgi:hypothetical protein